MTQAEVPYLPGADRPASRQTAAFRRRLLEDWTYVWQPSAGEEHRIEVPAGVEYNPSAPGVFHSIIPVSRMQVASAPHDLLYVLRGEASGIVQRKKNGLWRPVTRLSRRYADRLFAHVMHACRVRPWRVQLAYWGVRSPAGCWSWVEDDTERRQELQTRIQRQHA